MKKIFALTLLFFATTSLAALPDIKDIPSLYTQAKVWIDIISQIMFILMILATVLVRLFPKSQAKVDGWIGRIQKILSWLPTLGVNPRTKALEVALKDLQGQQTSESVSENKNPTNDLLAHSHLSK